MLYALAALPLVKDLTLPKINENFRFLYCISKQQRRDKFLPLPAVEPQPSRHNHLTFTTPLLHAGSGAHFSFPSCLFISPIYSFFLPSALSVFYFLLPLLTSLSFLVYFLQTILFIFISLLLCQLISFSSETI